MKYQQKRSGLSYHAGAAGQTEHNGPPAGRPGAGRDDAAPCGGGVGMLAGMWESSYLPRALATTCDMTFSLTQPVYS
jgi:hypothetical protein